MCGIVGFVGEYERDRLELVATMAKSIEYRGPDDSGEWVDDVIALGHRRLSILELSPLGHQPMASSSGRFVTVFNGEIYNFRDIRSELERCGFHFRGGSDTEVLLAAVEHWGVSGAVKRFNGMFAFAIWDRKERVLELVRDRLGVKPLYFGWLGNTFAFASEVKPFLVLDRGALSIDRNALADFFTTGFIPAPNSIYRGIFKLAPGCILSLSEVDLAQPKSYREIESKVKSYWSIALLKNDSMTNPYRKGYMDAVDELEALMLDSVKLRMISDVPFGAFLSGGIDSSTVVALMQKVSSTPIKTFTIGFDRPEYDEMVEARAISQHIGTEHTELRVTAKEALDVVPMLPQMFDEPFADSSQIPSYLVAKLARSAVTVSLSGDGGDELFLGYNRYLWPERIFSRTRFLPRFMKMFLARILLAVSTERWDSFYDYAKAKDQQMMSFNKMGEKIHKLAKVLHSTSVADIYLRALSHWEDVQELVLGGNDTAEGQRIVDPYHRLEKSFEPFTGQMPMAKSFMLFDQSYYLPDDLLAKADRTSMFVSLESREPVIDYRIVEFAARLPIDYCLRGGKSKAILRDVLYRYVPPILVDRPKMGFSVPVGSWLRGGLKSWAGDMLSADTLKRDGYLNHKLVDQKWREHQSGARNWQHYLWDVLMFQSWYHS